LTVGAILLFLVTLLSIYLTKSGIIDLRTSANKARYGEAMAQAERRLEIGMGWMSSNANRATLVSATFNPCSTFASPISQLGSTWVCRTESSTYSDGAASVTDTFTLATPAGSGNKALFYVIGQGSSADGTASAVVRQGTFFLGGATNLDNTPPITAAGNVALGGNFNVIANPNAGGTGVPVSIWSQVTVPAPSGAAKSCHLGDYLRDENCSAAPISSKDGKGLDIADGDANFPPDLMAYLFGVPMGSYATVKAQAQQVTDCGTLNAATTGIVWATGQCNISGTVGSQNAPVLLVVESAEFILRAGSRFYGLVFAFAPTPGADGRYDAGDITGNGGGRIYGVVVSNDTTVVGQTLNGTFDLVHDATVMRQLAAPVNTQFRVVGRTPASWADYLP